MDNDDECQYSISELHHIMETFLDGQTGYTTKYLKMLDHYGDNIIITEVPGKNSIVSFKDTAYKILHDKWYTERCKDMKLERRRIIETAAAIVGEDIRLSVHECDTYPSVISLEEMDDDIIPETLKAFVDGVIKPRSKLAENIIWKRLSIQQAMIAATKPHSLISPLHLNIDVYMHCKYGSRALIDMFSSMGFSASYKE